MRFAGRTLVTLLVALLLVSVMASASSTGTLWFGNDTAGTDYHTTTSGTVISTLSIVSTGVAWDGSSLYFGDAGSTIQQRSADGSTVLNTFSVPVSGSPAEDMAYDPMTGNLWRVYHNSPSIQEFSKTGTLLNTFALPTSDPVLGTLGALGVAYDSTRNQLDVSFCQVGCGALGGVVYVFDASTMADLGVLFRSSDSYIGGLGYDAATDTLWAGGEDAAQGFKVTNYDRSGNVLSSFHANVFGDGMEFIPTPEPSSLLLLGTGLAGLIGTMRRKMR